MNTALSGTQGLGIPDSTIVRRLPAYATRFADLVPLSAPMEVRWVKHVLVIEDETMLAELYAELLADEGYRTTIWTTSPTDTAMIAILAPDLIVLDLNLGPMADDGWVLLMRLKASPDTAAIPVLVCTALIPRQDNFPTPQSNWGICRKTDRQFPA